MADTWRFKLYYSIYFCFIWNVCNKMWKKSKPKTKTKPITDLLLLFLLILTQVYDTDFKERWREGEREIVKYQCEEDMSIGCLLYAPWLGITPTT